MVDIGLVKDSYQKEVELKYQLYNSLFLTLPLDAVEQTGLLLPLLENACIQGLEVGMSPSAIINEFFQTHRPQFSEQQQVQFLFKVIQYVERQVVLIDALEDAAYATIHNTSERDKLRELIEHCSQAGNREKLQQLLNDFSLRIILTAHPTQFYPGQVLAIITDLTAAITANDVDRVRNLLQQLGNTPFFKQKKPSPFEEAIELCWYLGNIFYPVFGQCIDKLSGQGFNPDPNLLSIGFWPGGDRDGNPFVTCDETRKVAARLRFMILECYHRDIRSLKRRLSFKGIFPELEILEQQLHQELTGKSELEEPLLLATFKAKLQQIANRLEDNYQGLFLGQLTSFQQKVAMFGFHFASLDIRQDSRIIQRTLKAVLETHPEFLPTDFYSLTVEKQIEHLPELTGPIDTSVIADPVLRDTLESLALIREIQAHNGERGCHRYVISNCRGTQDVVNVIVLSRLVGWDLDNFSFDIVPLFETINDLHKAEKTMQSLYSMNAYAGLLTRRNKQQTVMLGFSDGTKDGGYLMANWAIYRAKETITKVSREQGIEVLFFDGRGGPPARGGGNNAKFYAALGKTIESDQIQVTVQGQSISSYYGTETAARHNINQLLTAGLECNLTERSERELTAAQRKLIDELASSAYDKYLQFKEHPKFLPYLEQMSTLHYYGQSNIGSRPARRGEGSELVFEDLRAIPFVGAWGQLKQNVPGYYGLGSALAAMEQSGRLNECQALFKESMFFEALISNSMQSMSKTIFSLTSYMQQDPEFGEFWQLIYDEFELSKEMVLKVADYQKLLQDNPVGQSSIKLRMQIVLPLLVIQQHALMNVNRLRQQIEHETEDSEAAVQDLAIFEKMIVRSLFGNINASRNSA